MKPLFHTVVILVCDPIHILHLNSIFMLCDWVGERLTLKVALRYWSCIQIKISTFGSKVPLYFVRAEKWQLRWIRTLMIISLYDNRLGLLHFRDCRGGCLWRRFSACILWGNVLIRVIGKTESGRGVRSNQFIDCT